MDEQGTHEGDEHTLAPVNVISRTRPKALWGVLAAVAVAAVALVATSGGGEDEAAPLLPIALGSAGAGRQAESAADSMMAWVTYVAGDDLPPLGGEAPAYKLSGTVDDAQVRALADALGLDGGVEQQDSAWTVTNADGATLQVYEEGGSGWWFSARSPDILPGRPDAGGAVAGCVETDGGDGTVTECAPVTTLAPMPPYGECPPSERCIEPEIGPVDCAEAEAGDCPDPIEPPVDLPAEDEARVIALDLLAATGMDTSDVVVTVDGPYDAWYVTVEPRIDGTPTGLVASVSVGAAGAITTAGGYLGTLERLGDYPLLDTGAAIERLNEQMADGGWYAYSPGIGRDVAVAGDEDSAPSACPTDRLAPTSCVDDTGDTTMNTLMTTGCKVQPDGSEICEGSGSSEPGIPECPEPVPPMDQPKPDDPIEDCVLVDPVPVPMPEPEPTEVVLTGASRTLVMVPANDGSADAYLVPGYRFTGDDGAQVDAPAIADAALAGPTTTEPPVTGPVDTSIVPDPGGTDGGSTPPSGCEPLVEEDSAGTTHTIQPCIGVDPTDSVEPPTTPTTEVPETTTTVGD